MTLLVRRLSKDHDMTFGGGLASYASGSEAVRQKVLTRLWHFLGEFFLNTDYGVPWLQEIFVKPANPGLAESYIKQTIIETPGVVELISFNLVFNQETRDINIKAECRDEYGESIAINEAININKFVEATP